MNNHTVDSLKAIYEFHHEDEITEFLKSNPKVANTLFPTYVEIKHRFRDKLDFLELVLQEDEVLDTDELIVYVHHCMDHGVAVDLLDDFDEKWFNNLPIEILTHFNVHLIMD